MRPGRGLVALVVVGLATLGVVQAVGAGSSGSDGPPGVTVRLTPDVSAEELARNPELLASGPVVHEGDIIGAAPRTRNGECGPADAPDLDAEVSPGLAYEVVVDVTADCSIVVTDIRTFPASEYDEQSSTPNREGTIPPQIVSAEQGEEPVGASTGTEGP